MLEHESGQTRPEFPGWTKAIEMAWDRSTYGSYGDNHQDLVDDACRMYGVTLPDDEAELEAISSHARSLVWSEAERIQRNNADQGIWR